MNAEEQGRADRQEGFDRVAHGVTWRQLDGLDEMAVRYDLAKGEYGEPGSKKHEIVSSWLAAKEIIKKQTQPAPDHWYKKPIGIIGIAVATAVLVYLALSLLK